VIYFKSLIAKHAHTTLGNGAKVTVNTNIKFLVLWAVGPTNMSTLCPPLALRNH